MNFKRVSCLSLLFIIGLFLVIFFTVFFYMLGHVILAKDKIIHTSINFAANIALEQGDPEFILYIPAIDLKANIIPQVDPGDPDNYLPVIENSVAHGKYTYLPNEVLKNKSGITYLFAHEKGNKRLFEYLYTLSTGRNIYIKYNGNTYAYEVTQIRKVNPQTVEEYTSISPTPLLRIQTCADGITNRLIVDAQLKRIV